MVSLVLVSHSHAMADAVVGLARQMAGPDVRIAIAAGAGESHDEFGTNAMDISTAIQSVDSPSGVAVLMDLGSAILSAEMALELLPADVRTHVRLCPAPLVEGTLAGAVQASLGANLEAVCVEASKALQPKLEQLASQEQTPAFQNIAEETLAPVGNSIKLDSQQSSYLETREVEHQVTLTLRNLHGLHARPAARFVQLTSTFSADIRVRKEGAAGKPVSARSLNRLATLGAVQGDRIIIQAQGPDAQRALKALTELVESGFGELSEQPQSLADQTNQEPGPIPANARRVQPLSPGIGIGPIRHYHASLVLPDDIDTSCPDRQAEISRLQDAIDSTEQAIEATHATLTPGTPQEGIFQAHLLILRDEVLVDHAKELIATQGQSAAHAWHQTVIDMANRYRELPDFYLRQRYADVLDVGAQVLSRLTGRDADMYMALDVPSVLVATEFTPSQISRLDRSKAVALIFGAGGMNSHAAILTRALSIPAVAGASQVVDDLTDGTLVGVDGNSGALYIRPTPEVVKHLIQQQEAWLALQQQLRLASGELTYTRDGRRVEIAVNLSGLADAQVAVSNGAEAVGVLRTEFLYLTRTTAPSEDEQVAALQQITTCLLNRPIIVRTLDVGGDKLIPYLRLPPEANPYLGVRAIRLSLQQPEMFITQVRAILRAGVASDKQNIRLTNAELRILLPMVTLREELEKARALIEAAHLALMSEGMEHHWPVQVGIMVETPAAAIMTHTLTDLADFFSIGTNDLTQYTLAAERGNAQLASFADALHPAVLRLIQQVVHESHEAGRWAGVCGEIAADPVAAAVLIGLDVDELSMNVAAVPLLKAVVRELDMPACHALATQALMCSSADEVRRLASKHSRSQQA